jgi:type IV fimbrial biogenesis protein FimT
MARTTQRGITLIEACIVAAIGAITVTAAAPNFKSFIEKQRLDGIAAQLATDIQFARAESVMRNDGIRLSLQTQSWGSCYVIHSGATGQCQCRQSGPATCTGDAQQIKTVALPAADGFAVSGNAGSILFDPMHGTSTPAATFRVIAPSGRAVHHVVNLMGRVRSCSPQGDVPAVAGYAVC